MIAGRTIAHVIASPGLGGFFFDDQAAIKAGAVRDGAAYKGEAVTAGYGAIREPAESVSIALILDDGYVASGDCASVQYSGVGGREPRFHAAELASSIERNLAPMLRGFRVDSFRFAAEQVEQMIGAVDGLGRAAAYGISQALLDAAAHTAGHHLMARVIQDEWNLSGGLVAVPLYAQSGEDRTGNVDKMVLKRVPIIPHGLINTRELVGEGGEALVRYIAWIGDRVAQLAPTGDYRPVIHIDVYGMIGAVAGGSVSATADILELLEAAAGGHALRVEHPIDGGSRDAQIALMAELRGELLSRGSTVAIVADEWANTVEDVHEFAVAHAVDFVQIKTPDLGSIHNTIAAILDCQAHGVGPILGGTCAETDRSARTTAHIGIATGVSQMLAKPGMGVDEGLMIVTNEINRAFRLDDHLNQLREVATS
jgi:methylaspartate ammonia-lyase